MSNGPYARIAEIVEVTMPRDRSRSTIHHDPQYYRIRNHLVDFLVNRSRDFAGEAAADHDARHPPVLRPGLESAAEVVPMPVQLQSLSAKDAGRPAPLVSKASA